MGIPYTSQINNIYEGVMENIGVFSVEAATLLFEFDPHVP